MPICQMFQTLAEAVEYMNRRHQGRYSFQDNGNLTCTITRADGTVVVNAAWFIDAASFQRFCDEPVAKAHSADTEEVTP